MLPYSPTWKDPAIYIFLIFSQKRTKASLCYCISYYCVWKWHIFLQCWCFLADKYWFFPLFFPGYFHLLLFLPLCPDWIQSSLTWPENYVLQSWNKENLKIKSLAQINLDPLKQEVILGSDLRTSLLHRARHSTASCFQQWSAAEVWGKSLCGVVLFSTWTSARFSLGPSNEYHQRIYL